MRVHSALGPGVCACHVIPSRESMPSYKSALYSALGPGVCACHVIPSRESMPSYDSALYSALGPDAWRRRRRRMISIPADRVVHAELVAVVAEEKVVEVVHWEALGIVNERAQGLNPLGGGIAGHGNGASGASVCAISHARSQER
ncbi:hypothetical protein RRG08_001884 [Elysia crispata]|uniref:Uncharacterized protein n=1 Tax=Elysia crispata TaxID=231223 RepID=A0AAE1DEQ9_9GAST|nr:hypothetical protein RRG08_001884 [Elysia crispata]